MSRPTRTRATADPAPGLWRSTLRGQGPLAGFLALFVGIGLGTLFPRFLAPLGLAVSTGFGFIADAAPFIIFFTLVPAMLGMFATGSAARFALWVVVAFTLTTVLAGLVAILVLTPLFNLNLTQAGASVGDALRAVAVQSARLSYTSPPFVAIWWGTICALFLFFTARTRALGWFSRPTGEVITRVGVDGVEWLGRWIRALFPAILFAIGVYIPTGIQAVLRRSEDVFATSSGVASLVGRSAVGWYFLNTGVMVVVLAVFVFGFAYAASRYARFSFRRFLSKYFVYVYPFAWATASSTVTIPVNLERTRTGLGVRKEVRDFVVPLGATVNLDGTMIGAFVMTVTVGLLVGYKPTVLDLAILILPLTLVSVGVPGLPGGLSAVAPPVIVSILPIPEEAKVPFMTIFFAFGIGLSDQFRTGVNSVDNGILSMLFEHWYPTKFAKKRRRGPATGSLRATARATAARRAPLAAKRVARAQAQRSPTRSQEPVRASATRA